MLTRTPSNQTPKPDAQGDAHAAWPGEDLIALLIHRHRTATRPMLHRLWDYYRNELDFAEGDEHHAYRTAQHQGLPHRLARRATGSGRLDSVPGSRREIVVENDIAWRIHALIDFMFGKPITIESLAGDQAQADLIERTLNAVIDANGGQALFSDMALLGSVYGYVDLLVRTDRLPTGPIRESGAAGAPSNPIHPGRVMDAARRLELETVEAPRAIPLLNPTDFRQLDAYLLHYTQQLNEVTHAGLWSRLVDADGVRRGGLATQDVTEVWTDRAVRIFKDNRLVEEQPNALGRLPVVHIQNLPQPFCYEGLSEVEPLIPLQDELNTRLSDRANRVTFQSFKMYLGRGIEGFLDRPVGPGQMWTTDNLDASIEAFGGDGPNPSEDAHINEIREAMDKTSAVTAVSAGLLRNKVGNLTSENALRVVMLGLLARTEKKRVTYGQGIERVCEMVLHALHVQGVLRTTPQERRIRIHWPSPLPENQTQRLNEARLKLELGVPRQTVLAELGYDAETIEAAESDSD